MDGVIQHVRLWEQCAMRCRDLRLTGQFSYITEEQATNWEGEFMNLSINMGLCCMSADALGMEVIY